MFVGFGKKTWKIKFKPNWFANNFIFSRGLYPHSSCGSEIVISCFVVKNKTIKIAKYIKSIFILNHTISFKIFILFQLMNHN